MRIFNVIYFRFERMKQLWSALIEEAGDVDWTEVDSDAGRRVATVDDADHRRRLGLHEYQMMPVCRLLTT